MHTLFAFVWSIVSRVLASLLSLASSSGRLKEEAAVPAPSLSLPAEFGNRTGAPDLHVTTPRTAPAAAFLQPLSPLNNPTIWQRYPAYEPVAEARDVDVAACQKTINEICGTTVDRGQGNEIFKLVWNGDKRFWLDFFLEHYGDGKPSAPLVFRPRYKWGQITDVYKKLVRDVFPPRWILLTRLEPEQYAHTWYKDSHYWDPGYRCWKQVRPINPPPVYWMNYAIVAEHRNGCCARNRKCFGEYAHPETYFEVLRLEKIATDKQGKRNPFEKVDADAVRAMNDQANGYLYEMKELQIEAEVMVANPMAAIGLAAAVSTDATFATAQARVKDFYDRQIDELADRQAKGLPSED